MRNSGDQMNTAGCQLAGNCQPASTLFLAPENSQFICSRADKRYGCSSFGIAIAVNAILKTTTNEKEFGLGFTVNATIVISD
jgi:hypothetical protein